MSPSRLPSPPLNRDQNSDTWVGGVNQFSFGNVAVAFPKLERRIELIGVYLCVCACVCAVVCAWALAATFSCSHSTRASLPFSFRLVAVSAFALVGSCSHTAGLFGVCVCALACARVAPPPLPSPAPTPSLSSGTVLVAGWVWATASGRRGASAPITCSTVPPLLLASFFPCACAPLHSSLLLYCLRLFACLCVFAAIFSSCPEQVRVCLNKRLFFLVVSPMVHWCVPTRAAADWRHFSRDECSLPRQRHPIQRTRVSLTYSPSLQR